MPAPDPSRPLRLALAGLIVNVALAAAKLIAGFVGNSGALIADGIESLADILGSVVIWGGLHISARPADADHPYGHGKAEALAALAVAAMIIGAAVWIAVESIHQIRTPHLTPAPYTLAVLLAVVVIKETLFRITRRAARDANSGAAEADAGHHRSDAITSAAAFVGISIALIGGPGYEVADDWAALLASAVILYNGVKIAIAPVRELLDTEQPAVADAALRTAAAVPGVANVQKATARKHGPAYWVDMHVRVDPHMTVFHAHALSHRVKDAVRAAIPNIRDVLIHIEPAGPAAASAPTSPSSSATPALSDLAVPPIQNAETIQPASFPPPDQAAPHAP